MTTTMLIKLDKGLKEKAQKTAKELGLPLSTVINNYLKEFTVTKEITFKSLTVNAKTARAIDQARRDLKAGKNISPGFTNGKDAMEWLMNNG